MTQQTDSKAEDIGNIVSMEHVNLSITDQSTANLFYIMGLGFTRDPYINVGLENMWINLGEQQFHLPTRPGPQVIPGYIGLAVPSLDGLQARLEMVAPRLSDSRFTWSRDEQKISASCPWGNQFRIYGPDAPYAGGMLLGIPYVEFDTATGTAAGIVRFYDQVFGAQARLEDFHGHQTAFISIGQSQHLLFTERESDRPAYDGHHIAIYVGDFSGPCSFLEEHGLITENLAGHQIRFQSIVDPESEQIVFTLEHEVRSLKHPMFRRPLINRDPDQNQAAYARGRDALVPYK